jgi:hypothetical protein
MTPSGSGGDIIQLFHSLWEKSKKNHDECIVNNVSSEVLLRRGWYFIDMFISIKGSEESR